MKAIRLLKDNGEFEYENTTFVLCTAQKEFGLTNFYEMVFQYLSHDYKKMYSIVNIVQKPIDPKELDEITVKAFNL